VQNAEELTPMQGYSVYDKGLITICLCTLVFALIAIPLILRKVPRNPVYGFRTPTTLSNDFIWFETNAYYGRALLMASLVTAAAIILLYLMPGVPPQAFLVASIAVLVVPQLAAALLAFRFSRSLGPGGTSPGQE